MDPDDPGPRSFKGTPAHGGLLVADARHARSSVTIAAGTLQKAGLISYTRGTITVLNRPKLEEAACDCYGSVQQQLKYWENETS